MNLVRLKEYAELNGVAISVIKNEIIRGDLIAVKVNKHWMMDKDKPYYEVKIEAYKNWLKNKKSGKSRRDIYLERSDLTKYGIKTHSDGLR